MKSKFMDIILLFNESRNMYSLKQRKNIRENIRTEMMSDQSTEYVDKN